ncbi:MAG: hypothetical protein Kow0069_18260 [Promethearchaeota archaeon]
MSNPESPAASDAERQFRASFEAIEKKLEGRKDSFAKLLREVVRAGLCVQCTACVSVCPVLEWDAVNNRPKINPKLGKCTACGVCYHQCPRAISTPEAMIGKYEKAYLAKAGPACPDVKGQDGGVVTALLCYLLDQGVVDGAVVTKKREDEPWWPEAMFATTTEQVRRASGSVYAHAQTVEKLGDALRAGAKSVAFVGTPCNVDAVDKMQTSPHGMLRQLGAKVIKVGIFCMDAFAPETLYEFFREEGIDLARVRKMDISKGKFNVYYEGEEEPTAQFAIPQLDAYKSSSCFFCPDLTAESADVSVGSVGAKPGWNAVLVRTPLGRELFDGAVEKGYVELAGEGPALGSLRFLAKKKRYGVVTSRKPTHDVVAAASEPPAGEGLPGDRPDSRFARLRLVAESTSLTDQNRVALVSLTNQANWSLENFQVRVVKLAEGGAEVPGSAFYAKFGDVPPQGVVVVHYPLVARPGDAPFSGSLSIAAADSTGKLLAKKVDVGKLLDETG